MTSRGCRMLKPETCKTVFLGGHFLFICSDSFAVGCISFSQNAQHLRNLADDIHFVSEDPRRRLRSSTDRSCAVPRTHNTFGDRSFTAAGPRLWNSLPVHLRDVQQRIQLKLCLLTFKALHGLAPTYLADLCQPVALLAAERDCDLPLAATSSSAQLSHTLAPGHLLLQDPQPGIIFRRTYVRSTLSVPLKLH